MGTVNSTIPTPTLKTDPTSPPPIEASMANMTVPTSGLNLPTLKLFMVFIYSVMSLAIFFNIRVIYIVLRILCKRQVTKSMSRHGAGGNQHAFVYVLSLSIVDSFVLAHLPFVATDIVTGWVFGTAMCKLFWMIEQVNRILSTFILMALSGDRYLAVCHPMRFRQFRTIKAAVAVIVISVLVAGVSLTPTYIYSNVISVGGLNNRSVEKCIFDLDTVSAKRFLIYIFVCGYCIPFFFMVSFYWNILRTLWKKNTAAAAATSEMAAAETGGRIQRSQKRARHVTQRALILVLFYFGCWTPYWLIQFFIQYVHDPEAAHGVSQDALFVTLYVVHILTYLNSAVNPFLYALLNKELQQHHSSSSTSVHATNPQRQQSSRGPRDDDKYRLDKSSVISRCFANNRKRGSVEQDPNEMPLLNQSACVNYSGAQVNGRYGRSTEES